jgi:hypothetical protein
MKRRRQHERGTNDIPWWAVSVFIAMGVLITGLFVWGAFFYKGG